MNANGAELLEPVLAELEVVLEELRTRRCALLVRDVTRVCGALRGAIDRELARLAPAVEPASELACRLRVELPIRTFSEANARGHHMQKHKRVGSQRPVVTMALRSHARVQGYRPKFPCIVQLTRLAPDALDVGDNLDTALKHVRDGAADFLGVNDRDARVEWPRVLQERAPYGVRIEVFA